VLEPSALVDAGVEEARRLAALPAFGRVKQQLRAVTPLTVEKARGSVPS
jgi:hypothetical protein